MNRKDKTAQMIGQIIQPVDEHTTEPLLTGTTERPGTAQPLPTPPQKTSLQTTLSQELGLDLSLVTTGERADSDLTVPGLTVPGLTVCADLSADCRAGAGAGVAAKIDASAGSRYRITRLLSQEIGKRTFLATEECSQSQVVIKLLLFCPDLAEEEASLAEQQDTLPPYELPAHLPYLESFEANTPLGEGLILIKSFANSPQPSMSRFPSARSESPRPQTRRLSDAALSPKPPVPRTRTAAVPTVHPQFTYRQMRVSATPQKLQIQFPESYIHSGLSASNADNKTLTQTVELWLLTVLGTVVFVGGVVASTGSIPAGIVVAALLPVLYRSLVGPPAKRGRIAKLRVTSEPDGRAFISLTSMGQPIRDRAGRINGSPTQSKLHGSRLSIKSVKVSPTLMLSSDINPLKAKLSFTFHNQNWHSQTLSIVGSYAEIRWLSHHLAEWGRDRNTRHVQ